MSKSSLQVTAPIVRVSAFSKEHGLNHSTVSSWKTYGRLSNPGYGFIVLSEAIAYMDKVHKKKEAVSERKASELEFRSRTPEWYDAHHERRIMDSVAIDEVSGCWVPKKNPSKQGYVQWPSSIKAATKEQYVHRFMYKRKKGAIPVGKNIDHLCRNRACCNPDHLEAVSPGENALRGLGPCAMNRRKTHCRNGHPLIGANLEVHKRHGRAESRICKTCRAASARIRYLKKKAAAK